MVQYHKKILSVGLLLVFLFSIFFSGVPGINPEKESKTILSYPGILYLECVRTLQEGTGLEQETSRHLLQAQRRIPQRILSLRVSNPYSGDAMQKKVNAPREIGVLCMMVFLTIVIYIFRTDGKKRFVNE